MAPTPPDLPPGLVAELPTPGLFVDLQAADRNIAAAADLLRGTGVRLRPHLKAHKCIEHGEQLARWPVDGRRATMSRTAEDLRL